MTTYIYGLFINSNPQVSELFEIKKLEQLVAAEPTKSIHAIDKNKNLYALTRSSLDSDILLSEVTFGSKFYFSSLKKLEQGLMEVWTCLFEKIAKAKKDAMVYLSNLESNNPAIDLYFANSIEVSRNILDLVSERDSKRFNKESFLRLSAYMYDGFNVKLEIEPALGSAISALDFYEQNKGNILEEDMVYVEKALDDNSVHLVHYFNYGEDNGEEYAIEDRLIVLDKENLSFVYNPGHKLHLFALDVFLPVFNTKEISAESISHSKEVFFSLIGSELKKYISGLDFILEDINVNNGLNYDCISKEI